MAGLGISLSAGTLTGRFVAPGLGPVANGTLLLTLSQAAQLPGSFALVPETVACATSVDGSVVGVPNPTTAASGAAIAGMGTLPAGTYFVELAYTGAGSSSTLASPEGADYSRSLASLPGAFRKALLEGCWDVYEGQYFDHWDPAVMTMPRRRIEPEPWWPHWVGIDYGFNISQAAAYLLCKSPGTAEHPNGVTYVLEEYTAKHQPAVDFARELQQRFAGGPRQISGWYLSPDAWNQRGDGHTLADQMQEATRLTFEPASTDRVGGAMLIYCQLDRGELVVAESCRQLCEALPTRIHASDRPDDIAKIVGDPLDDCMDALRYAVYSYIGPARRPSGLERQAMITSPDPTVAMLQRRATDERWKKLQEPGAYVASRRTRR